MDEKSSEMALFKLMVLGPLTCRSKLEHGEIKKLTNELSCKTYNIPGARRCHLSQQTIERWYYEWRNKGFDGLKTKQRSDNGSTQLSKSLQLEILRLKKENPGRSLNTLLDLLRRKKVAGASELSRASLHRFLKKHNLSKNCLADSQTIERRSFEAIHAGDIWQGDVMHGPSIPTPTGLRKTYLVSILDDKSRLITHAAFGFGETILDIQSCFKQAILKRGLPRKLILDNGAAYRSNHFQYICAKLDVRLVYCPPYEPQGKGKQERFFKTIRTQFLDELCIEQIRNIEDLNTRLWAWLEEVYHQRKHSSFDDDSTPIERWRRDLIHVRPLGSIASTIDDYFYHRVKRKVKKDGTISYKGTIYEVPYELSGQTVNLVLDPELKSAVKVESLDGTQLGKTHLLDKKSNLNRKRQRPNHSAETKEQTQKSSMVELAHQAYQKRQLINYDLNSDNQEV